MGRIAVIGAGIGAMAAAARLAIAGHKVAVYERGGTHGGALGRLERDGFAFDTGPGLLHLPAVYRDLFVKTGKESLEQSVELTQVDPAGRHLFADGTDVSLPNASRAGVVSALDGAFGAGAGERWSDMVGRARDVWDATRRPLLEEPLRADRQALRTDPYGPQPVRRGRLGALFGRGAGRSTRPASLADVALRELRDPRLAALLEGHALAYGLDPRVAPASATVLPYVEQTFGTWYAAGGMRALADAVYERCLARRVEFVFGAEVTGVVEKDGRAAGVEFAGSAGDATVAEADMVVSGIDPARLVPLVPWARLWEEGDVSPAGREAGAPGRLTVHLALRGARPEGTVHRTVVHSPDRDAELAALFGGGGASRGPLGRAAVTAPTVTVLRPDDPATRPDDGHEAVTLSAAVAPHGPVDWSDGAVAEEAADRLLAAAEAAVPDLRLGERLLWREVRTPRDTEADTGSAGGSLSAPALAGGDGRFLHPANVCRVPGLYLAGGRAHPGGGLAHAGMSGALVAGLIVEGSDWQGSY